MNIYKPAFRLYILLSAIIISLISSCTKDSNPPFEIEVIDSKVIPDMSNSLRVQVQLSLSKPASVCISYWKNNDTSTRRLSKVSSISASHEITVILLEESSVYNYSIRINPMTDNHLDDNVYSFTTRALPAGLETFTNTIPHSDFTFPGYIHIASKDVGMLYLINDKGKIVWYQATSDIGVIGSNFDSKTNTIQCITGYNEASVFCGLHVVDIDLYGNLLMEIPYNKLQYPLIHHDIYKLQSGDIAVINLIEKEFDLRARGGKINELVAGDGFTIIDKEGKTKWAWSCFDYINPQDDPNIMSDQGEYVLPPVQDWMHANSLIQDKEGNFFISFNKLDQIWKIDAKTGNVIFKLGKNGDFPIPESAWTQHLHAVSIEPDGCVMILDNGAYRKQSRAISYKVNGVNKTAAVCKDILLPKEDYTLNQGSVYMMNDKNLLFGSTIVKTISILDLSGMPLWKYKTGQMFFRASYVKEIKL